MAGFRILKGGHGLLPGHLPSVPVELDGGAHLAVQEAVGQRDEESLEQGRRIYTEEKAKIVAAVWGTEFIQFFTRTI